MGVIYSILNKVDGKIYIGQSVNPKVRFSQHKNELNNGRHSNPHLQNAWDKYGRNSFEFSIFEYCEDEKLNDNETWWIDFLDSTNPKIGYNLRTGGDSNFRHSKETCRKISEGMKRAYDPALRAESYNKMAETRIERYNSTGYYRVSKHHKKDCKQGFYWRYQWRENGKKKSINSVDFNKLKEKVISQGLKWCKISEMEKGS